MFFLSVCVCFCLYLPHSDWVFVGTPPGEANAKTTFSDLKFRADQVSIFVSPVRCSTPWVVLSVFHFSTCHGL